MSDEVTQKKLTSRKFFIVLVWLLILIGCFVLAFCGKVSETIIEKVLNEFFGVCMLYLGVNVAQKGINAFTDIQETKSE